MGLTPLHKFTANFTTRKQALAATNVLSAHMKADDSADCTTPISLQAIPNIAKKVSMLPQMLWQTFQNRRLVRAVISARFVPMITDLSGAARKGI